MRILVLSDSHGRASRLEEIIEAQSTAKHVFFLGDVLKDAEYLEELYPDRTFYKVSGNCDFYCDVPSHKSVTIAGKKIFYTHGHEYGVKSSYSHLLSYAKALSADIVLYGHTHIPNIRYEDGVYLVNPGSVGRGRENGDTYAYIDIVDGDVFAATVKI